LSPTPVVGGVANDGLENSIFKCKIWALGLLISTEVSASNRTEKYIDAY
jgi:hypothetical protein